MLQRNRVVVSGFGILAANGIGPEAFWKSLVEGESGIAPVTFFDASNLTTRIAGEVKNFDPAAYLPEDIKPIRLARFTQFALTALQMAFKESRLDRETLTRAAPIPVIIGVSTSSVEVIEKQYERLQSKGPRHVSAFTAMSGFPQAAANAIAAALGVETQLLTVSSGCPAGMDAIAAAAQWIRSGKADIAVAGGTDTPITPLTMASFCASRSMSTRNDEPARASRPFDRDRDGGVMAEGCGVVILENMDHAIARGLAPHAEITGYGTQADPPGTEPGTGLTTSMTMALANASHRPEEVDYVCAHGPSDVQLDRQETASIKKVLGERAYSIPVSSIKGVTGNPLAASGPMQLIASLLCLREKRVPPTANYTYRDDACDLDYVPGKARSGQFSCILINNHGIGGTNSSMVLEEVEHPCN
mgnify:CR=1 FL=1